MLPAATGNADALHEAKLQSLSDRLIGETEIAGHPL